MGRRFGRYGGLKWKPKGRFVILILAFVFGACQSQTKNGSVVLEPQTFRDSIAKPDVQLIDVRTEKEFAKAHIPNARNMDYFSESFADSLKAINPNRPVFIYCRSGKRSGKSVAKFRAAGFTEIYQLKGGLLGWQNSVFETEP